VDLGGISSVHFFVLACYGILTISASILATFFKMLKEYLGDARLLIVPINMRTSIGLQFTTSELSTHFSLAFADSVATSPTPNAWASIHVCGFGKNNIRFWDVEN